MSPDLPIAHYRIISKLGDGGMGAVYRATRDYLIDIHPTAKASWPRSPRSARKEKENLHLNFLFNFFDEVKHRVP